MPQRRRCRRSAIRDLAVRGAPAIGIAAAWGVVLAARELRRRQSDLDRSARILAAEAECGAADSGESRVGARAHARRLARDRRDVTAARWSAKRKRSRTKISPPIATWASSAPSCSAAAVGVLTHCNTGSLATAGYGTALGVIRAGYSDGNIAHVFAGETRPWLQGARLTMWELVRDGIPAKLIADSAAAHLMKSGDSAVGHRRRRSHRRERRHGEQDRHATSSRSRRAITA